MKIAVEGCCHGELDKIYETIAYLENKQGIKVDLLLCCGDFQAVRNPSDLGCMAVPPKYQKMNTFYKYYSGEKKAPILTIFIGGNHEASNYLQELSYGGWVAPNIYYLGYAGVVQIGGVRIGGLSGIYKGRDYIRGRYEHLPYSEDSKRTVYHVRNLDVFRLKQLSRPVDIFLSHDWPAGVYNHGNYQQLARFKPYFADEMAAGTLGSPPAAEVLYHMKPSYWFAAHLHAKFAARVQHESLDGSPKETRFLALDKCLPKRRFLQLLDIPHDTNRKLKLELDPEWLCVLKATDHLLKTTASMVYMPGPGGKEAYDFTVNDQELSDIKEDFGGDMSIPENFERMADPYHDSQGPPKASRAPKPRIHINPQTTLICEMLGITDPITRFTSEKPTLNLPVDISAPPLEANPDEIAVDDEDSCSEADSSEEAPAYDSFIISHDPSAFELSTSKLDDSLDEKFVTAYQSMSEMSHNDSACSGLAGISEASENVSQDEGASSPPQGMLSPPATSGEEQSSDKDSSAYLSPLATGESTSPKRPFETETEPAEALFSSPKANSETESSVEKPKKFKRRNQSLYESAE